MITYVSVTWVSVCVSLFQDFYVKWQVMFADNVLIALGLFVSLVIVMIRLLLMWPCKCTDWLKLELSELVKFWQGEENLSHFQWT